MRVHAWKAVDADTAADLGESDLESALALLGPGEAREAREDLPRYGYYLGKNFKLEEVK